MWNQLKIMDLRFINFKALFIYLLHWSFKPFSTIFQLYDSCHHYSESKPTSNHNHPQVAKDPTTLLHERNPVGAWLDRTEASLVTDFRVININKQYPSSNSQKSVSLITIHHNALKIAAMSSFQWYKEELILQVEFFFSVYRSIQIYNVYISRNAFFIRILCPPLLQMTR